MAVFEKSGIVYDLHVRNRCVICLTPLTTGSGTVSKRGRGSKCSPVYKKFPPSQFNKVWTHLAADFEEESFILFPETPPLCTVCASLLTKISKAFDEICSVTAELREIVKKSGKDGGYGKERLLDLVEDLKGADIGEESRLETFRLLERIGYGPFHEGDFQKWFTNRSPSPGVEVKREPEDEDEASIRSEGDEEDNDADFQPDGDEKMSDESGAEDPKDEDVNFTEESESDEEDSDEDSRDPPWKKAKRDSPRTSKGSRGYRKKGYQHNCDFCREKVPYKRRLDHVRQHTKDYAVGCPNPACKSIFACDYRLGRHLLQASTCKSFLNKDLLTCEVCGNKSSNLSALRTHLRVGHETEEKPYPCPVPKCPSRFTHPQQVSLHIVLHISDASHSNRKFVAPPLHQYCPECKSLVHQDNMKDHLQSVHGTPPESIIQCGYCPDLFQSRVKLVEHSVIHMKTGQPVSCDICLDNVEYTKLKHLRAHYASKHDVDFEQFVCVECSLSFSTKKSLDAHQQRCHSNEIQKNNRPVTCDQCPDQVFQGENALNDHKIECHGGDPYKCQFCTEEFKIYSKWKRHDFVHKYEAKKFVCDIPGCGKSYKSVTGLAFHRRSVEHSGRLNSFVCEQCGKGFNQLASLKTHEKRHVTSQLKSSERRFVCDECGKGFNENRYLQHHKKTHSRTKGLQCTICNMVCENEKRLRIHLKFHATGGEADGGIVERRFKCDIPGCDKSYVTKIGLRNHQQSITHMGKTNAFKCDQCGKGFNLEGHLRDHQRLHTTERNFSCAECGGRYKTKMQLTNHIRFKHEAELKCSFCEQGFRSKQVLEEHEKEVHLARGEHLMGQGQVPFSQDLSVNNEVKTE